MPNMSRNVGHCSHHIVFVGYAFIASMRALSKNNLFTTSFELHEKALATPGSSTNHVIS